MPHATETLNSSTGGALPLPIPIPNNTISNGLYSRNIATLVTEPSVPSHNSYSDYLHNSVTCSADDSSTVHDQDLYVGCSMDGANFISPSSDSSLKTFEVNHCRDNMCCNMDHRNLHDLLQHVDTNHPRLKVVDGVIFPFETSTVYTQYNGFPTFNAAPIGFVHSSVMNSSPHSPPNESKSIINMSDDYNFNTYINDTPSSVMGKQKWGSQNLGQGQDDKSCESDTDLRFTWLYENKNALNPSSFNVPESTYIRDQTSSNSSSISTSYNSSPHAFQMNADQDPVLSAAQSPSMSYPPTPVDGTDSSTFSSPTNLGDFSEFISILNNQSSILTSSPPPSSTTVTTNINNNRQQNQNSLTKSNDTKPSLNNYTSFNYAPYVSRLNGPVRSQTTPPSSITNSQSDQCRRRSSTTNINSNGSDTNSTQQNSHTSRSSPNVNDDKSNNQRSPSSATISNQRCASSSLENSNLLVHQQNSFMSIGSDPDFSQSGTSTILVTRDQHRQLPSSSTVDPNLLAEMNDFMTSTNYLQGNTTSPIDPLPRTSSDSKNFMIVQNNSSSNAARSPCASNSLPPVTTSPYSTDGYHMVGFVSSASTNSGLVSSFVRIRPKTSNGMVAMSDVYADPALTSPDGFSQGKKFSKKRTISADTRTCKRRVSKSLEASNISSVTVLTSDVSLITETNGGLSSDDVDNHPYRCPVPDCTKAYKNANGLKYHNEHGHTSNDGARQKPWPCRVENCHKAYGSKGGLIYHVNRNHPNDLWALP